MSHGDLDSALATALARLAGRDDPASRREHAALGAIARMDPAAARAVHAASRPRVTVPGGRGFDDARPEEIAAARFRDAVVAPMGRLALARLGDGDVTSWIEAHLGDATVDALLRDPTARARFDATVLVRCVLAHPGNVHVPCGAHTIAFLALDGGAAIDGAGFVGPVQPTVSWTVADRWIGLVPATAPALRVVDLACARIADPLSAMQRYWRKGLAVQRIEPGGLVFVDTRPDTAFVVPWSGLYTTPLSTTWPAPRD